MSHRKSLFCHGGGGTAVSITACLADQRVNIVITCSIEP